MLTREEQDYFDKLIEQEIEEDDIPNEIWSENFCISVLKKKEIFPLRIARAIPQDNWTDAVSNYWATIEKNLGVIPIAKRSKEICLLMLDKNAENLEFIPDNYLQDENFLNENDYEKLVNIKGELLQFIPEKFRTEKICVAALRQNGYALAYFPEKSVTEQRCLEGIADKPQVVLQLKNPTPKMLLLAVRSKPEIIHKLSPDKQSKDLWLAAVFKAFDFFASMPKALCTPDVICDVGQKWGFDRVFTVIPVASLNDELCLSIVKIEGNAIKNFSHILTTLKQGEAICLAAVKKDGMALQHVPSDYRKPAVCEAAIKQDGLALQFVINKTFKLCEDAVKKNGLALQYVPKDYQDALFLTAIQQNGEALQFVPKEKRTVDFDLCKQAVSQNGFAIQYVPDVFAELLSLTAVEQNGRALRMIPKLKRGEAICLAAIKQDIQAYQYVPKGQLTPEMQLIIVKENGLLLEEILQENPTKEVYLEAVRQNSLALQWVPEEYKAHIIDTLSVEKILTKKFNAINYFPANKDYTKEIEKLLSNVEYILVAKSTRNEAQLPDTEEVYFNNKKHQGKTIIISNSKNPENDLRKLLGYKKNIPGRHTAVTLALVENSNEANTELGGIHYNKVVEISRENPSIQTIDLLGCNIAKATIPKEEKQMHEQYLMKTNKYKEMKLGLISMQNATFDKQHINMYIDFCRTNQLDGVYILSKTIDNNYQLLSFKLREKDKYEEYSTKIKTIPDEQIPNINKFLSGHAVSFPTEPNKINQIRNKKQPLTTKELISLRQLAYKEARFDRAHPKYKNDKKIYPFLATIKVEETDLTDSYMKKLVDTIQKEPAITWPIKISGPTKSLFVDTAKQTFAVTRTYLYTRDYIMQGRSLFDSKKPNIDYKKLKKEREDDIAAIENPENDANIMSKAKKITITTKKKS